MYHPILNKDDCAAMYLAVSRGDHEGMVVIYASAMKTALIEYAWKYSLNFGLSTKVISSVLQFHRKKLNEYYGTHCDTPVIPSLPSHDASSLNLMERNVMNVVGITLSNTQPPPSFVLYRDDCTQGTATSDTRYSSNSLTRRNSQIHRGSPLLRGAMVDEMYYKSLFHLACIVDSPFCLAILLAMGGDPSGRHSTSNRLPIHEAARCGSINCLRVLLDMSSEQIQASLKKTQLYHDLSLYPSSTHSTLNNIFLLSKLIEEEKIAPLIASFYLLSTSDLPPSTHECLICLPTRCDKDGNTPLHWAAYTDAGNAMRILIDRGADVDAKANNGSTPLYIAAQQGSLMASRVLLEWGADVDSKTNSGMTPLCFAAQSGSLTVARLLLESGANVDTRANNGMTPLCFAAQEGSPTVAQLLLESGADVHAKVNNGMTPLCIAAQSVSPTTVRLLLKWEANMDVFCILNFDNWGHFDGEYSLLRLCEMAQLLKEAGIKCQMICLKERMILDVAIEKGSPSDLKVLLRAGMIWKNDNPHDSDNLDALETWVPQQWIQYSESSNHLFDKCKRLVKCERVLNEAGGQWSPASHYIFGDVDRKAIKEVLMVGKRKEQFGICKELWIEVLSFCKRGWFEKS